LGLLLLRATLGITAIVQGAIVLSEQSHPEQSRFIGISAIACGISILLGFLTPVISALLFSGGLIAVYFSYSDYTQIFVSPVIYGIILSAAVVLLGPGAFSLDARLFGRREIFIPKN